MAASGPDAQLPAIARGIRYSLGKAIDVVKLAAIAAANPEAIVDSRGASFSLSFIGNMETELSGRREVWAGKFALAADKAKQSPPEKSSSWHDAAYSVAIYVAQCFAELQVPPNSVLVAMANEGPDGPQRASQALNHAENMFAHVARKYARDLPTVDSLERILARLDVEAEYLQLVTDATPGAKNVTQKHGRGRPRKVPIDIARGIQQRWKVAEAKGISQEEFCKEDEACDDWKVTAKNFDSRINSPLRKLKGERR